MKIEEHRAIPQRKYVHAVELQKYSTVGYKLSYYTHCTSFFFKTYSLLHLWVQETVSDLITLKFKTFLCI